MNYSLLENADVKNKRVLLRVTYDVPLITHAKKISVADDSRIRATLPTIKYLLKQKCKIVILTKIGRPGGQIVEGLRVDPVALALSHLLKRTVRKLDTCVGPVVRDSIDRMKPKDIIMLENVRFHQGEERGDRAFAKALAAYGDIVVFDAFPESHRDAPSTTGILGLRPSVMGFDMSKELKELGGLLNNPARPFVVLLGGAKIVDKIATFRNLLSIADVFLVGGALAHHLLKAHGTKIGPTSGPKQSLEAKKERKKIIEIAEEIIEATRDRYVNLGPGLNVPKLILPLDLVAASGREGRVQSRVVDSEHADGVPWDWLYLDIGPKTVERYGQVIDKAKTIFWNGPLGYVENDRFAAGTRALADRIAKAHAKSIVGGGDTEGVLKKLKLMNKFDYVSTGGGAALEFLAQKPLPVLKFLTPS